VALVSANRAAGSCVQVPHQEEGEAHSEALACCVRYFPFVKHSHGHHTCTLLALGAVITSPLLKQSEPIVHRLTPHMCLGLDNLVELCKNYATTFDDSRTVTVGIVGWPGVGKSSLLTQLKTLQDRTLTAEEGEVSIFLPRPMATTYLFSSFLTLPPDTYQDFHIATNVRILDYVGLVVPSSEVSPIELSLRGCIPADNVPNPFGAGMCHRARWACIT